MILKALSEAVGVSGKEDAVRTVILDAISGHANDIRIDPLGSVTAVKPGDGEHRLRVLLAAHMDEVGLMVTGVDGDGLLRFTAVGGIDERILPGLRVRIGDKGLPGCVIWTPIHKNRDQNVAKMSSLRIDIGVGSKDGALSQAKPGDRIAFESSFVEMDGGMLRGRAFDDRVGCALLVDVLRGGPYPVDVLAAFTVQEEIGVRGAQVAAQTFNPDVALVLEASPAHDLPNPLASPDDDISPNPGCRLGDGPVLTIMDRSLIVYPPLLTFLRQTAAALDIPYQYKTQPGGGTDGGAIHTANAGTPTAVISVPCRYIHSPTAYLRRDDYDHTLRLVQGVLTRLTADVLAAR